MPDPSTPASGSIEIAPRRPADVASAVEALRQVHEQDGYPAWWPDDPAAWLTPPGTRAAWLARQDGVVVGHVCVVDGIAEPGLTARAGTGTEHLLSVSRLVVRASARGRRLGARLLAVAEAEARTRGARLVLDVVDDDGPAIHLYGRLGWRPILRRPSDWTTPSGHRWDTVFFLAPAHADAVPPPR